MELAAAFGITPDRFKRLIPSEFILYAKAHSKRLKAEDDEAWKRTARLCVVIAHSSGNFKRKFKDEDFMPKVVKKTNKVQTPEAMFEAVRAINKALGGKEVKA
jgi:hypothetical protein